MKKTWIFIFLPLVVLFIFQQTVLSVNSIQPPAENIIEDESGKDLNCNINIYDQYPNRLQNCCIRRTPHSEECNACLTYPVPTVCFPWITLTPGALNATLMEASISPIQDAVLTPLPHISPGQNEPSTLGSNLPLAITMSSLDMDDSSSPQMNIPPPRVSITKAAGASGVIVVNTTFADQEQANQLASDAANSADQANADKIKADAIASQALADKKEAEKVAAQAVADKNTAEATAAKAAVERAAAAQILADKRAAAATTAKALAEKAAVDAAAKKLYIEKLLATQAAIKKASEEKILNEALAKAALAKKIAMDNIAAKKAYEEKIAAEKASKKAALKAAASAADAAAKKAYTQEVLNDATKKLAADKAAEEAAAIAAQQQLDAAKAAAEADLANKASQKAIATSQANIDTSGSNAYLVNTVLPESLIAEKEKKGNKTTALLNISALNDIKITANKSNASTPTDKPLLPQEQVLLANNQAQKEGGILVTLEQKEGDAYVTRQDELTVKRGNQSFTISNQLNSNETQISATPINTPPLLSQLEINANNVIAKSDMGLSVDPLDGVLTIQSPMGPKKVSIMPDEALGIATELKALQISKSSKPALLIANENSSLIYRISGEKVEKLFGQFPIPIQKQISISVDTGSIVKVEMSAFYRFVSFFTF